MMPKTGTKAPDFTLPDQDGKKHSLADYRGKNVILYFYPKDDTPGCTTQACGLRDSWKEIEKTGAAVLGISADSVEKHERFAQKYDLPFTLLSDPEKETIQAYGCWVEKSMYGKKYMGIARNTFVIDENGVISHIIEKVKPATHADAVIKAVD